MKYSDLRASEQNRIYSTCFRVCGRLQWKGVSCGWEDSAALNFSRSSFNLFFFFFFTLSLIISRKQIISCSDFQILGNQIEPLTEQQVIGICNLQQSSQQAEDALSQGMEALQQSLAETLSSNDSSANVAEYMGQMAIAMSKLATLENFLHQVSQKYHN